MFAIRPGAVLGLALGTRVLVAADSRHAAARGRSGRNTELWQYPAVEQEINCQEHDQSY